MTAPVVIARVLVRAVRNAADPLRRALYAPVVPGVNDASSETRERITSLRDAALARLAACGVTTAERARVLSALDAIDAALRVIVATLDPGALPPVTAGDGSTRMDTLTNAAPAARSAL